MHDGELQEAYNFSDAALTNHWVNLFIDRSKQVVTISDADILAYINKENYSPLRTRLEAEGWTGYLPDLKNYHLGPEAFDERGFAKDDSGWVAFNYKPQPSIFWPTNGSTDDVLIRLPIQFRTTQSGHTSNDIYMANLALLEIAFQVLDSTTVPPIDKTIIQLDLDDNGSLGITERINRRTTL